MRVVRLRLGIVLAAGGGALARMVLPFRLFLGGRLGSGRQWMSWIHERDFARAVALLLERDDISGPVNIAAPNPLPQREFMENAKTIWERLGLPPLTPQTPWHGYDLGYWPEDLARQARIAHKLAKRHVIAGSHGL